MTETEMTITPAEWEVMRIVWTLDQTTSTELIDALAEKMGWSASTTKTLISRLVKKNALSATRNGRSYQYAANIVEQDTIDSQAATLFDETCAMHHGQMLLDNFDRIQLSQGDIDQLVTKLTERQKTAPVEVDCNCMPNMKGSCDE
ncbi:CopY/TcrY family copper transport repressor [Levilactobacillus bambusae]|uniref:CopY/TcrY family copper transport repressor n=1 Tax=Levilactobacillus bambusae TaxID=2024736 RepID=A0A2V1MZ22_9LACO|nr:CopY/TcrY family copper transport repressor [Levilactobacillus bambusae]PWG00261.1 CopY/TcrY family copper transport repressor [Levilactobacillus bambusae]